MTAMWAPDLPKCALPDTRWSTYERAVREFKPDLGPPLRRTVQSTSSKVFGGTFRMTTAQMASFWSMFRNQLRNGLSTFTMRDPDAGEDVTVEFLSAEPPMFKTIMRGYHDVDLSFRVVA